MDGNAVEIAWFPFEFNADGQPVFHTRAGVNLRYNPGCPIAFGAMATHHILDEDVVDCPMHTDFILPVISGEPVEYLIGHNIDYDNKVLVRGGVDTSAIKRICTLAISQHIWPDERSHTLGALVYMLSPDKVKARETLKDAHSAWQDILMTAAVLRQIIQATGVRTTKDLYLLSEMARIPKKITFGKHKGMLISELPFDYVNWLLKQPDTDAYLKLALKNAISPGGQEDGQALI
jgi:exodeoxyribonuclease X